MIQTGQNMLIFYLKLRVHIIWTVLVVLAALFALVVLVYWLNLDTKLVKALEKPMMKHYDKLRRDHRL